MLYYGLSREELEVIHGEIEKSNRQSLKAFSLITLFFIMGMFCLSYLNRSVEQYRFWYFFFLIMMAAVAYFIWNLEVEGIWLLGHDVLPSNCLSVNFLLLGFLGCVGKGSGWILFKLLCCSSTP